MNSAELCLLEQIWFPIARAEDVAVGGIVPARLLGLDLVVYRAAGEITVAQGFCPHRGAALRLWQVVDGQLQCAYHGWRYDSGGQCVAVPSLGPTSSGTGVRLRTYPTQQALGLIWTCLGDPVLPIPTLPAPVAGEWTTVVAPGPYDIAAGMRTITENFRDISHLPFVHRATLGADQPQVVAPYQVVREGWRLMWTVDTAGVWRGGGEYDDPAGDRHYHYRHSYELSLPSTSVLVSSLDEGGDWILVQVVAPLDRAAESCRQFNINGIDERAAAAGVRLDTLVEWEVEVQREDRGILETIQPREAPLDPHAQANTRADKFSIMYRRLYQELVDTVGAPGDVMAGATVQD
jgi:phenylpropionate dioxygenase-like ring-hydroxylating dioxygenase large terminal subunit